MKIFHRVFTILVFFSIPLIFGIGGFVLAFSGAFGTSVAETPSDSPLLRGRDVRSLGKDFSEYLLVKSVASDRKQVFELGIPKIAFGMEIALNIDPYNQDIYEPVISSGIAHAKYSLTPDQFLNVSEGVVYVFGHRQGEAGYFSRLGELKNNDLIFLNHNGVEYTFKIISTYVVPEDSTSKIYSSNGQKLLRLQTCENGEEDRLIVDAVLVDTST